MSRTFRLGIFIVSALLILAIGVFLIGDKEFLFSSTYRLQTNFKSVAGLVNGADVRVAGIRSGTVQEIRLPADPDKDVVVVMDLGESTKGVLRKDSVASIQTEGLLGNKFVEISFGTPAAPPVDDGVTIRGAPPMDISDLMKKTDDILDTTRKTMSNVKESSEQIRDISTKVNDGKGTAGALINDQTLYRRLNDTVAQAKGGAAAFREDMEALKTNFFLRGFFNRRGYDDVTELTRNQIPSLPQRDWTQKFTFDVKKLFEKSDTAKLRNEKDLNEAGRYLQAHPFELAVVVSRHGMRGDAEEMLRLTQARAMVVREYLAENFRMDDTQLKTFGAGKSPGVPAGSEGVIEILVAAQSKGSEP